MENTKITLVNKLKKEAFNGVTVFELVLFSFFSTIGISVFLYIILTSKETSPKLISSYVITLIDIPIGIIAATSLSKKSKYAPLLLVVDSLLYGTSNFLVGNNSLGFVNAILTPILWMFAYFYLWKGIANNDNNKKEIETKKLDLKIGVLLVVFITLFATFLALTMHWHTIKSINFVTALNVWFDSFAASLMFAAVIMGILRFREVWYLYLFANVLKIILFSINLTTGNSEDVMLLIMSSAYLINSIFGLFIWFDSKKVNLRKK